MDAFSVSLCKGFAMKKISLRSMTAVGIWFGFFQALMPLIGFAIGGCLHDALFSIAGAVSFLILLFIGLNMIREGISGGEEGNNPDTGFREMLMLAIATSLDALAAGFSISLEETDILLPAAVIGIVTASLSMIGVKAGSLFGSRYGSRARIAGGIILIAIGIKILYEAFIS